MSAANALVRARGQIMFLAGLVIAASVVLWLNAQDCVPASEITPVPRLVYTPPADVSGAWQYIERNTDAATGLVNAEEQSGWTTGADTGHALRATIAAQRLRLITGRAGHDRIARALRALGALPAGASTARIDTRTGQRVEGVAPDPAPLVGVLELIAWTNPPNNAAAVRELDRWQPAGGGAAADAAAPAQGALARHAATLVRAALTQRGES